MGQGLRLCRQRIGEEVLENEDKDILVYVINFASGFEIKALSSGPQQPAGMQSNVVIDEGAFHKDHSRHPPRPPTP